MVKRNLRWWNSLKLPTFSMLLVITWFLRREKESKLVVIWIFVFLMDCNVLMSSISQYSAKWGKQRLIDIKDRTNYSPNVQVMSPHLLPTHFHLDLVFGIFSSFHRTESLANMSVKIKTLKLFFLFFLKVIYQIIISVVADDSE